MEKFIFVKPNSIIKTKTESGQDVELKINSFKFEAVVSKASEDGYFKAGEKVSVVFE
jgi:hypothetical protein